MTDSRYACIRGQSMHGRQEEWKYKFWKIAGNLIVLLITDRYNKILSELKTESVISLVE